MRPARRRRRARILAAVGVILSAGLILATPAASMPASAADRSSDRDAAGAAAVPAEGEAASGEAIQVVVQTLNPTTPTPTGLLVVTGRVANTTDAEIEDVAVRLRLSTAPLPNRTDIQAVVDGSSAFDGLRVEPTRVELAPHLRAGGQVDYRIAVPFADLPLPTTGVYVLGVEALARRDGVFDRVGLTRTFLPWFPDPSTLDPTRLVWLWPVADWPARNAAGVLLGDRTPRELSPGGRLRRIVDAGGLSPTSLSWIVDPELAEAASSMSGGYSVRVDGQTVPGERTAQAADWLAALTSALSARSTIVPTAAPTPSPTPSPAATSPTPAASAVPGEPGMSASPGPSATSTASGEPPASPSASPSPSPSPAPTRPVVVGPPSSRVLPYADVDAAALRRAGLDQDVVRSVTSAEPVAEAALDRAVQGGLFWAPGGDVDQPTLDLLASAGVDTVVLSDAAMPPDPPVSFTPSGSASLRTATGSVRAVLTDSGLTAALDMPQATRGEVLLARQRFLAETAQITLELPGTGRTVVAAPSSVRWNPSGILLRALLTALRDAPWVTAASLDDLLSAGPSDVRRARATGPASPDELSADYLGRVRQAEDELAAFGAIVDDPTGLTEPYSAALLRTESAAWRVEPRTGEALLRQVRAELAELSGQVRVRSKGTVTFAGERGVVPVTIANDLDRPVTVGLRLIGYPPLRLDASPVPPLQIEPGRSRTVEVEARVVGSGPLPVDVQLTTPQGSDYGRPARIDLRSTAYARAAAGVVGAALLVLALLVGLGLIRRARRGRRGGSGAPPADHPSGTVSP